MVVIGRRVLDVENFYRVIYENENIELDNAALQAVEKSFEFLEKFSKNKIIYGINTGLGPMAQYKVGEEDQHQLQLNLIRSHCAGSGNLLSNKDIKATVLSRLNTLMLGYSGVHREVVELLGSYINNDVLPMVYEHGGVGASGDLVQLAHVALAVIGEGDVLLDGKKVKCSAALKKLNLKPAGIHIREGLAIMNGTSAMTGIGMINIIESKNMIQWMLKCSVMINEVFESFDDHFSTELNNAKLHNGQQKIAQAMREMMKGSKLVRNRADYFHKHQHEHDVFEEKFQEPYSVRCVPQVLGPIYDTISNAEEVLVNELNSANDNPIIDVKSKEVYHGGNFHGDYVSMEMDKLKIAITKLSMLSERQLNYLMNDKMNDRLKPFVNLGKPGLTLGMQGTQFTATSTVAENQTLSFPNYVHSISCNNDNQDIVSMGTNTALLTRKVINNAYEVIAIELIALAQAVDYLKIADKLSLSSSKVYKEIRKIVPAFKKDAPLHEAIVKVREYIGKKETVVVQKKTFELVLS